ncbi:MAG: hypothetical protein M3331_00280, partial [Actinomycetota bacterium]|nr:hypothetical protein [Actinomycetota bacterium]
EVEKAANKGSKYFNPLLSSSRRVFDELTRNPGAFEGLLVDAASLSDLLAERDDDLTGLVANASSALGAIGRQRTALADAIGQLPDFMRQANTTFVNLQSTLDDLDPLVAASIPVAQRLRPFFSEFRAAAADAVPTIRDLDQIVRRPGDANDLIELTNLQVPLARVAVGSGAPDCGDDPMTDFVDAQDNADVQDDDFSQGSFGETVCALRNSNPQLANLRAYIPELVGWFDDFSTSGTIDASGPLGRIESTFNTFSVSDSGLVNPIDLSEAEGFDADNDARCPSSLERNPGDGSAPFTDGGSIDCDPSQVPTGP